MAYHADDGTVAAGRGRGRRTAGKARQDAGVDGNGLVILVLALIAVATGTVLVARSRVAGFALSARPLAGDPVVLTANDGLDFAPEPAEPREPVVPNLIPLSAKPQLEAVSDPWRDDLRRVLGDVEERVARLDERLADLSARFDRRIDELVNDIRANRDETVSRQQAVDARQEAAIERLRADVASGTSKPSSRHEQPMSLLDERRLEVTADLYARLARLEASIAAVTNPVLLPGEAYAPPAVLLDDALDWGNWSEAGERVFALADAYSAQRLFLSDEAGREVADFVAAIRALLTRQVYPALQGSPTQDEVETLRLALGDLANDISSVRVSLEREFHLVGGGAARPAPPTRRSPA